MTHMCMAEKRHCEGGTTEAISRWKRPHSWYHQNPKRLLRYARNDEYAHGKRRDCEGATNGATEANRRFNGVNLPGGNAHTHAITRTQKDCFAALAMTHMCMAEKRHCEGGTTEAISRWKRPHLWYHQNPKGLLRCARNDEYAHCKRRHCEGGRTEAICSGVVSHTLGQSMRR